MLFSIQLNHVALDYFFETVKSILFYYPVRCTRIFDRIFNESTYPV